MAQVSISAALLAVLAAVFVAAASAQGLSPAPAPASSGFALPAPVALVCSSLLVSFVAVLLRSN